MAFVRTNLGALTPGGNAAPKVFTYISTTDNKAAVAASGYFNTAFPKVDDNAVIIAICSDGGQTLQCTYTESTGVMTTTAF
jgi:hypothetical protein